MGRREGDQVKKQGGERKAGLVPSITGTQGQWPVLITTRLYFRVFKC